MKFSKDQIKFLDRSAAGRMLATTLLKYKKDNPVILALPRGGVPVGFEIAKKLESILDVFIVRKIGAPSNMEFGVGAVAEGGVVYLDKDTILRLGISQVALLKIIESEEKEIDRQVKLYRSGKQIGNLKNKIVIIVDDGLATGVTALVAIEAIKSMRPGKIIFASPVCAYDTFYKFEKEVDDMVCSIKPSNLQTIGSYYDDFKQVTDEEVLKMLGNFPI